MNVKERYVSLMEKYRDFDGSYRIKIDTPSKSPIYIAISASKKPVFLFDIACTLSEYVTSLHETAGYKLIYEKVSEDFSRIGIEASNEHSFEVFYVVVSDLIDIACSQTDSVAFGIISRLVMWEEFFKNAKNGLLDYETQLGLFGELLFIEEEVSNGYLSIIDAWKGPLKDVKDFIVKDIAIEVKTSSHTATNRIHISDENQLDSSGFSHLFLNVRFLVQNQMDGLSLPELVDNILKMLGENSSIIQQFKEKLMHAGYRDEFRDRYDRKYEQSDNYWYEVKDTNDLIFPRIIPSDLRSGVKFVKYQIELSTLQTFMIDWSEIDEVKGGIINE